MKRGIVAAIAVLSLAQPASAQDLFGQLLKALTKPKGVADAAVGTSAAEDPGRSGGRVVEAFDIAGVRLGMTPEEARAALSKSGFKYKNEDGDQFSWQYKLDSELEKRGSPPPKYSRVSMLTMGFGPNEQRVEVWYAATPGGARVGSVTYSASSERILTEAFEKNVAAKYGDPTAKRWGTLIYCSPREVRCEENAAQKPYLTAKPAAGYQIHKIVLGQGTEAAQAAALAFDAEVERRAPKAIETGF